MYGLISAYGEDLTLPGDLLFLLGSPLIKYSNFVR